VVIDENGRIKEWHERVDRGGGADPVAGERSR
jgi:hypothetical protein